jgi:DNA-binding transcriptional MerR regulator
MADLKIGVLAERAGTNAPTIRYYEEIGLLPRPRRRRGGQRCYDDQDLERLIFVRHCREFGFSIEQVRSLVALRERGRSCMDARDLAYRHLLAVREKLRDLKALERDIAAFVTSCNESCAGGPGPECEILDELARKDGRTSRSRLPSSARGQRRAGRRGPGASRDSALPSAFVPTRDT